MRSLKKRGPHVLDDLMTSYFPYITYNSGGTVAAFIISVLGVSRRSNAEITQYNAENGR